MTLLAEQRLKRGHLDFWKFRVFPQALDPDPMQRAPVGCILFPDEGHIVFHRTGSDTSLTSRAQILIDHHAPAPTQLLFRLICKTRQFNSVVIKLSYFS